MRKLITTILTALSFAAFSQQVREFSLTNVVDGKTISLNNYISKAGVIIIFTLNNCPFDDYYTSRIKSMGQDKIPLLLVNSSLEPVESNDNMVKRASQLGLNIPYLSDKDQILLQDLNGKKSTEVFLLKNINGKFTLFYHGSIDDNPQVAADVKHAYLTEAIEAMLSNKNPDVGDVRPMGCTIRRK